MPMTHVSVEPLRAGERMTLEEFILRVDALGVKQVELIGGRVHIMAPPAEPHADFHSQIDYVLRFYARATAGCKCNVEAIVCIGDDGPVPDVCLRIREECGGAFDLQIIGEKNYIHGSPELLAEVSDYSVRHDLGKKLKLYCSGGVKEYVVVLVQKQELRWHRLVNGAYKEIALPADGVYRSKVFPGFWIKSDAFFADNDPALEETLKQGLASSEHAEFVRMLESRGRRGSGG